MDMFCDSSKYTVLANQLQKYIYKYELLDFLNGVK